MCAESAAKRLVNKVGTGSPSHPTFHRSAFRKVADTLQTIRDRSESRPYLGLEAAARRGASPALALAFLLLASVPASLFAAWPEDRELPPVPPPLSFPNGMPTHYKTTPPAPARHIAGLPVGNPDPAWWKIFGDATLNSLEQQATAGNQDVARAVARIEVARTQTRIAAADFLPRLDLSPSYERLRTTNTGPKGKAQILGNPAGLLGAFGGGGSGSTTVVTTPGTGAGTSGTASVPAFTSRGLSTTYSDYRAPLTLRYEVDVFGRIRHDYASARASQQAVEADRRQIALSLSAEVAANYFALRAFDSEVGVLQRSVGLRRDAVQINQARVSNGVANPLDLSRARVELDSTEGDLDDALRQRDETENRLAELCGQPASDFRLPARPLEEVPLPSVPAGVPSSLLMRRPDLAEAERQLAAATESIGSARAQFLPTFNIQGNAGFESSIGDRLFDAENRELSILGTINVPIFEGGRNVANLRAAKARRDEAVAAYRATAITAFKEVENALADLRRRATQAESRQRASIAAADVLDRSQKRYIEGAINYFDVVDAQRSLLNTDLSRVQTLAARFAATIDLVRALGGSWDSSPQRAEK